MSRGPGAVERGVLHALARYGPMNATELAQDIFGRWGTLEPEPTAAQLDSVRWAISHLAARGVIVEYFGARSYWQLAQPDQGKRRQPRRRDPSEFAEVELADRFVKLLGLLSSDHAGERANAVAAVERLRQRYGISWRDIVREGITDPD